MLYDFFYLFPSTISKKIKKEIAKEDINKLEEIRFRTNQYILLKYNKKEEFLEYKISTNEIIEILQVICESSIYSYQKEISEGYITVRGGHRIGITGNAVMEDGKVININYISSLNFRVAKQIIGCSNNIIENIIDKKNNTIFNTLIVSLPGVGKTTLLRDIIRNISYGNKIIHGQTIGVVDERGEITSTFKGVPQNDVGPRTDILSNIPKSIGIKMLIRSMSPQVIAVDEIGNSNDVIAIREAICSRNKAYMYSTWR